MYTSAFPFLGEPPMYLGQTVFSQVMDFLPWRQFHSCVGRYDGNVKVRRLPCIDHFRIMALAQLTYRESLRDIEACLQAVPSRLYHMGIRHAVPRSTLADANRLRDWRIYADFAHILIDRARRLYADEDFGVQLKDATLYALDTTTIDLCLSLFPWAHFRRTKAAVKMHTLMDLRGNIPAFIHITDGLVHEVNTLDLLLPEPGAFYIMDRGFLDYERLCRLHQGRSFFVTRAKVNTKFTRRYSRPIDKSTGLQCDQTIMLDVFYSSKNYPEPLRRIRFRDPETGKLLVFLTNNFQLPALTITTLYKARWQIELFFKWIKQHLRIKAFYGTSPNAVKSQIWIAIATYVTVAILKKELRLKHSLYTILQILSVTIFEKTPILQVFSKIDYKTQETRNHNQLTLFDL